MADLNYQYKYQASINIVSGGFEGEKITIKQNGTTIFSGAVGPRSKSFKGPVLTATAGDSESNAKTGTTTYTYTYFDTQLLAWGNSKGSRVEIEYKETWKAWYDTARARLVVVDTPTIVSVKRFAVGNPPSSMTHRYIIAKWNADGLNTTTGAGGETIGGFPIDSDPAHTTHTIITNAGGNKNIRFNVDGWISNASAHNQTTEPTLWYLSTFTNHKDDPKPNIYTDILSIGVSFTNPNPVATHYKLTYNMNGGTGGPANVSLYSIDDSHNFTVSSTQPTWGSYKFLGWSTKKTGDGKAGDVQYRAGSTVTAKANRTYKSGASEQYVSEIVLYAVWEKDYRPGSTYTGSAWASHDRSSGAANIYTGSWRTMRTVDGGSGTGNPPYIYNNGWKNQRLTGNR